jgi:hypothetical protein
MSNPKTKISYRLFTDAGFGFQSIGPYFDSEMSAKHYALTQQSKTEEVYEIRSEIVTVTTVDSFTVPAHVPNLEEIAQEIIGDSDGSFYMEWGDDIEQLNDSERSQVEKMVWEEISPCDCCGWHFHVDNLEQIDGEMVCWKCAEDMEKDEDESDED